MPARMPCFTRGRQAGRGAVRRCACHRGSPCTWYHYRAIGGRQGNVERRARRALGLLRRARVRHWVTPACKGFSGLQYNYSPGYSCAHRILGGREGGPHGPQAATVQVHTGRDTSKGATYAAAALHAHAASPYTDTRAGAGPCPRTVPGMKPGEAILHRPKLSLVRPWACGASVRRVGADRGDQMPAVPTAHPEP